MDYAIGRSYEKGNLEGEKGNPIEVEVNNVIHYKSGPSWLEYDVVTKMSKKTGFPCD